MMLEFLALMGCACFWRGFDPYDLYFSSAELDDPGQSSSWKMQLNCLEFIDQLALRFYPSIVIVYQRSHLSRTHLSARQFDFQSFFNKWTFLKQKVNYMYTMWAFMICGMPTCTQEIPGLNKCVLYWNKRGNKEDFASPNNKSDVSTAGPTLCFSSTSANCC